MKKFNALIMEFVNKIHDEAFKAGYQKAIDSIHSHVRGGEEIAEWLERRAKEGV